MRLLIVTGMSGSGKTIVLHSLEDEGYYCIDNMPVFLLKNLADRMVHEPDTTYRLTAVGIDVRSDNEGFSDIPKLVKYLKDAGIETTWDKEIIALIAYLQKLGTGILPN